MERVEKLKEFLSKSPGDNFLQHALALEYIKEGNGQEAKRLFEEILHRDPGYIGSYYHLADLVEKMGDRESAISWYEKGMQAAKERGDQHSYNELRSAYEELLF